MRIGELAKRANVSRDTIRHYLGLGLLKAARDPENGYQIFSSAMLQRLLFIRTAKRLGFRLEDIALIFSRAEKRQSPCPGVRDVIIERIRDTRKQIAELEEMCRQMESAVAEWQTMPDGIPDGTSVCRLIESRDLHSDILHE
jgi:DNA-binding transcriptional MerR regulator